MSFFCSTCGVPGQSRPRLDPLSQLEWRDGCIAWRWALQMVTTTIFDLMEVCSARAGHNYRADHNSCTGHNYRAEGSKARTDQAHRPKNGKSHAAQTLWGGRDKGALGNWRSKRRIAAARRIARIGWVRYTSWYRMNVWVCLSLYLNLRESIVILMWTLLWLRSKNEILHSRVCVLSRRVSGTIEERAAQSQESVIFLTVWNFLRFGYYESKTVEISGNFKGHESHNRSIAKGQIKTSPVFSTDRTGQTKMFLVNFLRKDWLFLLKLWIAVFLEILDFFSAW